LRGGDGTERDVALRCSLEAGKGKSFGGREPRGRSRADVSPDYFRKRKRKPLAVLITASRGEKHREGNGRCRRKERRADIAHALLGGVGGGDRSLPIQKKDERVMEAASRPSERPFFYQQKKEEGSEKEKMRTKLNGCVKEVESTKQK